MKTSQLVRLVVAFLFVAALFLQVGQVQNTQAAGNPATSVAVSAADQAAALAYWTPAAMANARALPMPVDHGTPPSRFNAAVQAISGPVGFGAPGAADPSALSAIQVAYSAAWKAGAADNVAAPDSGSPAEGTPAVYDSYYVNLAVANQKVYPNVWVGRLFETGTPGSFYCSATAINTNLMVTAAHCVYDLTTHHFFSKWVFTPAYRNGNAPYGSFAATVCWVLNAWIGQSGYSINGATPYDVAVCTMGKNSAKKTLNQSVGFAGYMYGYGSDFDMHDLGYPWEDTNSNALPNAGAYLRLCTAESYQAYSGVLGMGCNLGPGISGGSWIVGYQPNVVTGWIDSVNSGYYPGNANMYGIQFSSSNFLVLCRDNNGCP
ncbi:MAG: hypothetical protein WCE68_08810 [Anaerolineales bacterium]